MSASDAGAVASFGFENIDILFETEGVQGGNLVTINSEPSAPGFEFLMNIFSVNLSSGYYITNRRGDMEIREVLTMLGNKSSDIDGIISKHQERNCDGILEIFGDLEIDNDVIVIDSIDVLDAEFLDLEDMYQKLKQIAWETESVIIVHRVVSDVSEPTQTSKADYISDIILSISGTISEEGINERLWVEKLPKRMSFKPSQANRRVIKLDTGSGDLSVNTGGSI